MIFLALFHPRKRAIPTLAPSSSPAASSWCSSPSASCLPFSAITGCGTSFTQNATPAGAYTFQIVATGNHTTTTNTAAIQLTQ